MDLKAKKIGKQRWLTEIVSGLGEDATPARIREEAYRVGFGAVSPWMLIVVRNALWPGRKRRTTGLRSDGAKKNQVVQPLLAATPCPECQSERTRTIETYVVDGNRHRKRRCNDCGHKFMRIEPNNHISGQRANEAAWSSMKERLCTYCKRTLPVDSFSLAYGSEIRRRPGCKECSADNRAKYNERDLIKRYGITMDDYRTMIDRQSGRCAICGTDSPFGPLDCNTRKRKRRVFSVDHCHKTGKVRGLLCGRCNIALGNFNDDTDMLRAAIGYIESHKEGGD